MNNIDFLIAEKKTHEQPTVAHLFVYSVRVLSNENFEQSKFCYNAYHIVSPLCYL